MKTRGGYRSFTLALSAALLLGCGGAKRDTQFPSREEIAELTAAPPPAKIKVGDGVDAPTWQLVGPLPEAVSEAPAGATPWGQAVRAAVAMQPGALASQAMECVAHEAASFVIAHDNRLPGRAVRRFIAGRCGAQTSYVNLGSSWLSGIPATRSDAEVYAAFQGEIAKMLASIGPGPRAAGLSFVRSGDKAAVVIAGAHRRVRVEPIALVQNAPNVVIRGDLLEPAERIRALVTSGNFGFQECIQNYAVDLPRFEVSCPLTRGSASATIELVGFPANRLLGETMLDVTVFPDAPSLGYTGSTAADSGAPMGKAGLFQALTTQVNAVRKNAGMRPLRVSMAQSKTADVLAPYYFAAVTGGMSPLVADKVALGMMAGWDVEGEVREGHFSSGVYPHLDPTRLLDELAARPFGRETLFDPDASAVALGILPTPEGALGAVIGTYSSFDGSASPGEELNQVYARLTTLRGAKGLPAPRGIAELDQEARRAAAAVKNGDDPEDALQAMLRDSVAHLQSGGVKGWAMSASTVKDLKFPSELLSVPNLNLAISVVHHKYAGSPWTQLLVFVVILQLDGQGTARAGDAHHG